MQLILSANMRITNKIQQIARFSPHLVYMIIDTNHSNLVA